MIGIRYVDFRTENRPSHEIKCHNSEFEKVNQGDISDKSKARQRGMQYDITTELHFCHYEWQFQDTKDQLKESPKTSRWRSWFVAGFVRLRIAKPEKKIYALKSKKEKLRIEEREEKLRFEQLRLDEQKRKDEFELEKLRIQTQSKLGADTSKESDTKFLVKEVSKFIHRFDLKEDISLYLKLFERQAQRLNIDQENWVSHLLGLLPTEVSHIIAREPDDKANSYEHVKDLLLKRFKLTPEKFRQLFVTHQKASERTWIDFYHELNTYFNGWIDGLKIDTFNKLSDLIITDQLKRKTPF
ncbi:homeotic protein female sterile [Trichonephila clavipes]|nr:homeotic protein female sterile [Trichonephila clavipes]